MNQNIKKLLRILDHDEELLKQFADKKDTDELYRFCISIQEGYTKEEFIKTMTSIARDIYKESSERINDNDMEKVVGGKSTPSVSGFLGGLCAIPAQFRTGYALGQSIKSIFKSALSGDGEEEQQ